MNIFTSRLDNIEIGSKKAFSVVPKDIKNIEGYIGNIKYLDEKLERVIDHAINHSDFISKAQKALLISKPLFTFLYPSNEKDFKNENKESKDSYYMYKDLYLHNLTVAFALGLWLVKDNAVNVNHSYHFNPLINYNSTYNRTLSFTLSSGEIKSTYYSENEINNSISLMYDIYSILLKNVDLLKISSSESYGTTYWSLEDFISNEFSKGNTSSYARAFIYIQEARSTGFIPTKISKYCACLECLFAIKEKHSNQIKDITSKLLANDSSEEQQIASDMGEAYGIRSDIDHGGEIKYFRDLEKEEVKELSERLDDYVRQTIKYVLNNSELNYTMHDIEHKAYTRKHFKDL